MKALCGFFFSYTAGLFFLLMSGTKSQSIFLQCLQLSSPSSQRANNTKDRKRAFLSYLASTGSLLHTSMKDIFSVFYFLSPIFLIVIPQQFKASCLWAFPKKKFFSPILKQTGKHLCSRLIANSGE